MTEIPPVDLLLAGGGAMMVFAFAFAAVSFDGWRRATRRQSQHILSHSQSLLEQLTALDARVNATAAAVRRLDERMERNGRTATQQPLARPAPGTGYHIAIRLAKSGATRDELMTSCGLSFAEAELVRRLHGAGAMHGAAV